DLDRKLGAVLAAAIELQAHPHRAHARLAEEAVAMARMLVSVALRHQELDPLLEQLAARIAEQPLGLRIDQHDASVASDDDDRIGSRFQEPPELLLRLPAFG